MCFVAYCNPWKGAQVDIQDNTGWTALMKASREGHTDIVGLLLDKGVYTFDGIETQT